MTLQKWYDKMNNLIDQQDVKIKYYQNDSNGVCYVAENAFYCYKLQGQILTANEGNVRLFDKLFAENQTRGGIIVKRITRGKSLTRKRNAIKLETDSGVVVYAQERFFKNFPKNADLYVTAYNKPIYVSLWDNSQCNIIGLVMPYLGNEADFVAREANQL